MAPVTSAEKIAEHPDVYLLPVPGFATPLIGVFCEDLKEAPLPDAALIMRDLCCIDGAPQRQDWDQEDACQPSSPSDARWLAELLRVADTSDYALWCFAIHTIETGPHAGLRAVAIGSNTKKRERAGNLALALTVAAGRNAASPVIIAEQQHSMSFRLLARSCTNAMMTSGGASQSRTVLTARTTPIFLHDVMPPPPPPPPRTGLTLHPTVLPPPPLPAQSGTVTATSRGSCSGAQVREASADSDRSEVVMFSSGAAWLDGATYGSPSRVAERLGLETTSTNAASHNSAPQQGTLNERPQDWLNPKKPYHPVITSSPSQASTDSDVEASDGAVPHASWIPFGDNLHLPDDPDGGDGIRNYYVQKALKDDLRNDQNDHDVIRRGLENQLAAGDAITIGTIRTVDTVPLGTDLDPHNAYNNAWAARRITDAPGKALLTHDLGRRVLDAENLGFTYGQQVHGERKFYHQGVKNAVAYFLQEGLQVIVVGKRSAMHKSLAREVESGRCHILIADDSDDVFVMKQAFEQRCPMVSRDNFRVHQTDLRIKQDVRRWICGAGGYLQVKFMFDRNGAFNVDYDHQMPILCPSHH